MDCWEFKNCPEDRRVTCPTYPDNRLDCWRVTGTMCGGVQQGYMSDVVAISQELSANAKTAAEAVRQQTQSINETARGAEGLSKLASEIEEIIKN